MVITEEDKAYCTFPGECDKLERISKIGQYLTKLCVDYGALLFGPPCICTISLIFCYY